MYPVLPVVIEVETWGPFRPTFDSTTAMEMIVMSLGSFSFHTFTLRVLPPFKPNQYLEETRGEQWGPEPWKIFTSAVEDVIVEYGKL